MILPAAAASLAMRWTGLALAEDGTSVTLTFDFAARLGLLGALAERLMMRREMGKSVQRILSGLKHHVETGETVGQSLLDSVVATGSMTSHWH